MSCSAALERFSLVAGVDLDFDVAWRGLRARLEDDFAAGMLSPLSVECECLTRHYAEPI
jgi:hypothetical protein